MTDEDQVTVEALKSDIATQVKKLRTICNRVETGEHEMTAVEVMKELYVNLLPLVGDTLSVIGRLEDHAAWASEEIVALGGGEGSSQLTTEDAERLSAFLRWSIEDLGARTGSKGEGEFSEAFKERAAEAQALLELVDDITLEGEGPEAPEEEPN